MMTDAQYFIKSQGNAMLPLRLPSKADLWSVTVDGAPVAPIQEEEASDTYQDVRSTHRDAVC